MIVHWKIKQKSHRLKKKCTQKDSEEAPIDDVKLTEAESEQNKHAISLAFAATVAAGAAVAAAQAAAEVVRLTSMPLYPGKTKEDMAAIKIQTAFRGYLVLKSCFIYHKALTQTQTCRTCLQIQ